VKNNEKQVRIIAVPTKSQI